MKELERKRDALVVRAEPLDATRRMYLMNTEVMQHAQKWALRAELAKAEKRGEVQRRGEPTWNFEHGVYQVRVLRLRPAASTWRKPLILIGTAVALLLILGGLLWWVMATLGPVLLGVVGGTIGGLLALKLRRPVINIFTSQNVTVRR